MKISEKMHQLRDLTIFFLRKTKIFQIFIKPTKKNFWPKKKGCLIILNDKPNCQASRILMSPRNNRCID
jgi:hypothetical protein